MKWQSVNGFLTVPREQVSETLGKDWYLFDMRLQSALTIKTLWEADVLPLHHSREKRLIDNETSVYSALSDIAIQPIHLH